MGLTRHGPRELSNLERAAIDLVFGDISKSPAEREELFKRGGLFNDLKIVIVPKNVGANGEHRRGSYSNNKITIAIDQHLCADNLSHSSALGNEDILKPGNMDYLNTFIHEATHHWQSFYSRYQWSGPNTQTHPTRCHFTEKELTESPPAEHKLEDKNPWFKQNPSKKDILNLWKEQHASAAATWFVIGWQLKYASNYVDLTTKYRGSVGTVDRYDEIKKIAHGKDRRWIRKDTAIMLASAFDIVLAELRTGYYWRHVN